MVDGFEKKTEDFLIWLKKKEVQMSPKMALVDLRHHGRGRGIIARSAFDEDEVIFTIPRPSTLNIKNTLAEFCSIHQNISMEALTAFPEWAALAAIMASESQRKSSRWSPYFEVLPKELDSLIFWSTSELAELQGSAVLSKIGKAGAETIFCDILTKVSIDGGSIDLLHSMASVIMAYAFDVPEDEKEEEEGNEEFVEDDEFEKTVLTMIPLADMLNADAHRNNARLCYESENLEMRAIKRIAAGEEIFNDYGQLPRSDLLRRYGYITDNYTPFDVVEISTAFISEILLEGNLPDSKFQITQDDLERRIGLATREDIFEDAFDLSHATPESSCIPDELIALIYLLLVNDSTFSTIEQSETSFPSRSKLETELAGELLSHILRLREQQYATTLQDDENVLKHGNLSHRHEMAIKIRMGEKKILHEALEEVASYQGSNKSMRVKGTKRMLEDGETGPQKKNRTD